MAKRDPNSLQNAPECKRRRLDCNKESSSGDLETELELSVQLEFSSLEECKKSGQLTAISSTNFVEFFLKLKSCKNGNTMGAMITMKGSVVEHLSQATIAVFRLIRQYTPGYQLLILLNKVMYCFVLF